VLLLGQYVQIQPISVKCNRSFHSPNRPHWLLGSHSLLLSPGDKAVATWIWPLTYIQRRGSEWVELYLPSPYAFMACPLLRKGTPPPLKGCSFYMSHSLNSFYCFQKVKRKKITNRQYPSPPTKLMTRHWWIVMFDKIRNFFQLKGKDACKITRHLMQNWHDTWTVSTELIEWKHTPPSFSVSNALRSRVKKKNPQIQTFLMLSCLLHRHWNHLMSLSARKGTEYPVLLKCIKNIVLSITFTPSSWHSAVIFSWPLSCAFEAVK